MAEEEEPLINGFLPPKAPDSQPPARWRRGGSEEDADWGLDGSRGEPPGRGGPADGEGSTPTPGIPRGWRPGR